MSENNVFHSLLILIQATVLTAAGAVADENAFVLVRDRQAECVIVTGADDGRSFALTMERSNVSIGHPMSVVEIAAHELADRLNDIAMIADLERAVLPERREFRRPVEVVDNLEQATGVNVPRRILLGSTAVEAYGLEEEAATLPYGAFIYRVVGDDLLIFGSSSQGAANGVYALLRDEIGVHWFGPGDLFRVMPDQETIAIGTVDRRAEQDIFPSRYSIAGLQEHPSGQWARRNAILEITAPRSGYIPFFMRPHTIREIVPVDTYGDRPELYALRGNNRYMDPGRFGLCYSNPEVAEIVAEAAIEWFDASEYRHSFPMGINDSPAFCECEDCLALQPERSFRGRSVASDMYYHFVNDVARKVSEVHPDRYLIVSAYNDVTAAPLGPVEDNVVVRITTDISEYYDPAYRAGEEELFHAWAEKDVPLGLSYYGGLAKLVPGYFPTLLSETIKKAHDLGFVTVGCEVHPGWPWRGPMHYLEARLFWDIDLDPDQVLEEYFTLLYGPAAEPMRDLFALFDEIHSRPRGGDFLYEHYNYEQFRPFTAEDRERIEELIAEAHASIEELGVGRRGTENVEGQRVAYVSNGLKVFRDMLEGRVLAQQLEAADTEMDAIGALEGLEQVERIQKLLDRHEALYRETILSDPSQASRYLNDTCTPVRVAWINHLTSATGDALIAVHNAVQTGNGTKFDHRIRERLERAVEVHRQNSAGEARYMLGTGEWKLGDNNMISNPGFEELDEKGNPVGWSIPREADLGEGYILDVIEHGESPATRGGRHAARMEGITRNAWFFSIVPDMVPGRAYLFEADAKMLIPGDRRDLLSGIMTLRIEWDGPGTVGRVAGEHRYQTTLQSLNEWERLGVIGIAPEGVNRARLFIRAENMGPEETILVDNVSVRGIVE